MFKLAIALLFLLTAHAAEPFLNLGFEALRGSHPREWRSYGLGYEISADSEVVHSGGTSLRIECSGSCSGAGVALQCFGDPGVRCFQSFPLDRFRGKLIRFSGYIRTESVTRGYAGLSLEVYGNDRRITYDDMRESGPRGTTPWTRYVIEQQVASGLSEIEFGVRLAGNGKAWFDSLQIEVDGKIYAQPPPPPPTAPTAQQIRWLKQNAIPFANDQPGQGFQDLEPLKEVIGNARIVGVGEQTHGTSEFQRMKHRLLEFLVNQMGFTAIVMEGGMTETYPINESLQKEGVDVPRQMADNWPMHTQEVSDLFTWMRQFNKSGNRRIELFGIDMRKPRPAITNVRRFLADADPELAAKAYQTLDAALQQPNAPPSVRDAGIRDATDVLEKIRAKRNLYAASSTPQKTDWAIQCARIVLQASTWAWSQRPAEFRDLSMADNVDWILEQDPAAKVLLWAHNDHVAKEPRQLGGYLADRHGSGYKTFGFAFHEGRYNAIAGDGLAARDAASSYPGSVEYFLYRSGIPRFVLPLHRPNLVASGWLKQLDWRNIGSVRLEGFGPNPRLTRQFDALIFFDRTTPSRLLGIPPRPQ